MKKIEKNGSSKQEPEILEKVKIEDNRPNTKLKIQIPGFNAIVSA